MGGGSRGLLGGGGGGGGGGGLRMELVLVPEMKRNSSKFFCFFLNVIILT